MTPAWRDRRAFRVSPTMHTFARKPKAPGQAVSENPAAPNRAHLGQSGQVGSILQMQRTLGNQAVQRQAAPAPAPAPTPAPAQPPPQPLFYDRGIRRQGQLLDRAFTKAELTTRLTAKVRAGELSRFEVRGVPSGSQAEIFILAEILATARKSNWGTESDFVAAIGWPAKAGDPVPQGQITLRISPQGAATAELIATGLPAVAQTTLAAGSARVMADFGFSSVTGWPGSPRPDPTKSAAEISDVIAALDLLKARAPQDVNALRGLKLIRVDTLPDGAAGEFSMTEGWLKLATKAFDANADQFFGGGPSSPPVPSSFQTILHEVGHAVEAENLRFAREGLKKAQADLDTARQRIADDSKTFDAEFAEAKRKRRVSQFYKDRAANYKKLEADQAAASALVLSEGAKVDDAKVTAAVVQPFKDRAAATNAAAASSLTSAKSALQALNPDEVQSSAAYLQAVEDAAAAIASFPTNLQSGSSTIDDVEKAVLVKVTDRNKALTRLRSQASTHRAIPLLDGAVRAQDAWFEAERLYARVGIRTRRVQKFIEMVNANGIKRFTQYSVDNWLMKPGEFYAEAYSLWLVDPHFLQTNYPVVFNFFQNGDYRTP